MLATTSSDAVRLLLGVFGLLMLIRAALLLRRLRDDRPAGFVGDVVLLAALTALIGVVALIAAAFTSPATLWTLVAAMVALPISRLLLGRQHR
jgi:uncharacterized membrane protein